MGRHPATSALVAAPTALTNWRSVCWTLGTSWTRLSLTSGVNVFERVYGQKADISSSSCKGDDSIVCRTVWQDIFSFINHDVCNLSHLNVNIPQVVWQYTLGVVDILMGFVYNLLLFLLVKEFHNRLGFDNVIGISSWSTFGNCISIMSDYSTGKV